MNTKDSGKIRVLTYKEGSLYYSCALELNITSSGEDKYLAMYNLDEAIRGYIDFTKSESINEKVLNQKTDPDLEFMWKSFQNNSIVKSPIDFNIISTALFERGAFT